MKSDVIKKAAMNNTEKDFELSFFDNLDAALVKGLEQNRDFFTMLLKNQDVKQRILGIFVDEIYKSIRKDTKKDEYLFRAYHITIKKRVAKERYPYPFLHNPLLSFAVARLFLGVVLFLECQDIDEEVDDFLLAVFRGKDDVDADNLVRFADDLADIDQFFRAAVLGLFHVVVFLVQDKIDIADAANLFLDLLLRFHKAFFVDVRRNAGLRRGKGPVVQQGRRKGVCRFFFCREVLAGAGGKAAGGDGEQGHQGNQDFFHHQHLPKMVATFLLYHILFINRHGGAEFTNSSTNRWHGEG